MLAHDQYLAPSADHQSHPPRESSECSQSETAIHSYQDDRKNVNDPGEERAKGEEASSSAEVFTYCFLASPGPCPSTKSFFINFPSGVYL